jgi:iron complex outermembrane recepter protein
LVSDIQSTGNARLVWNLLLKSEEGVVSKRSFPFASWIFTRRFALVLLATATLLARAGVSQSLPSPPSPAQPAGSRDLATVSLEDLMNTRVTSVSKTEQKMSQAAAAIAVITQEDISRSGARNIPDLLRMVPGMDVSQINANSWAISARGFNQQFGDKLLVLIDGRAVYTPLLGGVNWDTQDVLLQDIDRIEVIRGPGATVWGANAVNGVINIVTKRAADTKGGLLSAGGGTERQADAAGQFGGAIHGNTDYRVFAKYLNRGSLPDFDGGSGDDGWHLVHAGIRADTSLSPKDSLTLEGDLYTGSEGATIIHIFSVDPPVVGNLNTIDRLSGGNILGRWNHTFSSRAGTSLQFYYDNYERTGPESIEALKIADLDFNYHFGWGERQNIVWGVGYRHFADQDAGTIDQSFNPPNAELQLFTFFGEDTVALRPDRLYFTFGTKVENSYFTGYGLEPSVRLAWTPVDWATFWSSVSRSERSPTRRDAQLVAPLAVFPDPNGSSTPVEVILSGDPKFAPERVIAYEAGFRAQPNGRISVDVSAFFNQYDHLESLEPGTEFLQNSPAPARLVMPIKFGNLLYGTTEGGEVSANLKLTDRWTLSPGYAFLEMHLKPKAASQDQTSVAEIQGSSPQHQAQLRSHVDLSHGLAWDASAYFVGALPIQGVASYTRVDTQLRWKFAERAELSLVGQNLLQENHLESMDAITLVNSSFTKRNAYAEFTWRFW